MSLNPSDQAEKLRAVMREVGGRRMADASGPEINGRVEVWIVPRTGGTVILHDYGEPFGCEFYWPAGSTLDHAEAFIRGAGPVLGEEIEAGARVCPTCGWKLPADEVAS